MIDVAAIMTTCGTLAWVAISAVATKLPLELPRLITQVAPAVL